ncbi:VOC family protein [Streptomyces sp. JJ66]|uniref:VOC family protein n=1 Tax=Streptomyces sp. JJ66 TaxID=2803843 RepID=UPI001C588B1B|nr:VOC family protein [Streptomyces sp. JJ66]MBW1603630.1 VOC family protein [Streptomyces sp. JJ66]
MATQIHVNLPVKDLPAAKKFFAELGYAFEAEFTDDNAACLVIEDNIYVMLLTEDFFRSFSKKEIPDTGRTAEAILALGVDSRERVDELVDKALAAGGTATREPMDEGFMYARSFQDLDGHLWEVITLDLEAMRAQQG